MKANVLPGLEDLLTPIEELDNLKGNPRMGDVEGIAKSYQKFKQARPIVAVEKDGRKTVIAGNHQLEAAKLLGWTHIAVIVAPYNDKDAIAFALTDNRLSELGDTDEDLLFDMLKDVIDDMPEFFEMLGWDDFELAAMEPLDLDGETGFDTSQGWQPPELAKNISKDDDDEMHWDGDEESARELVTQGSTSAGVSGSKNAVVQYTLVFDTPQQQSAWYTFLRWVKPRTNRYPGETTAAQLVSFIETHTKEVDDEA